MLIFISVPPAGLQGVDEGRFLVSVYVYQSLCVNVCLCLLETTMSRPESASILDQGSLFVGFRSGMLIRILYSGVCGLIIGFKICFLHRMIKLT